MAVKFLFKVLHKDQVYMVRETFLRSNVKYYRLFRHDSNNISRTLVAKATECSFIEAGTEGDFDGAA